MSTGDPEQENHLTNRINQEIDYTKIPQQGNNEIDDQPVTIGEERSLKDKEIVEIFCIDSAQSLKTTWENVNVDKEESNGSAEHFNNDKHPEENLKDKPLEQSEHHLKLHKESHDADKFDLDNKPVHDALVKNAEEYASTATTGSEIVSEGIVNGVVQPEGISDVVLQDNKMQKETETIPVELHVTTAEAVVCKESEVARGESLVEQSHSRQGTSNETKEVEAGKDAQGPEGDNPVNLPSGTVGETTQLEDGIVKGTSSSSVKESLETATSKPICYTDDNLSTIPQSVSEEMSPGKAPEEVSYSTTVVGGVVHRVPMKTSSPKAQQKNSSSPQSTPRKKKSIIDTLFGHRTKSKGVASPTAVPGGKDGDIHLDRQENDHNISHQTDKSTEVGQDGPVLLENGTAKEGMDTNGLDIIHKREDKFTHPAKSDKNTSINPAEQLRNNNVKEEVVAVLKSADVPCEPEVAETNDVEAAVSQDAQTLEEKTSQMEQSKDSTVETVFTNQKSDKRTEEQAGQEITWKEAEVIKPIAEQDDAAVERNTLESKPMVQELKVDGSSEETAVQEAKAKPTIEKVLSPGSKASQDEEDADLKEHVIKREANPSQSPKTRRMQMRISYAEGGSGKGGKEVEVISTPEGIPEVAATQKGKTPPDYRVPCRALGDADHEGWLAKKGGTLFFSTWKRKWVVLKEGKLYYYKTSFDQEASGIINMEDATVAAVPETKKNFCFKCVQPGPKPQVTLFMADSQEDMDKWLSVLSAAIRGENIQKPRQQQQPEQYLSAKDDVALRRKTTSNPKQRTSSVLAVGGRPDFLEEEEDTFATRRRSSHESTPRAASPGVSSPEKGVFGSDKETSEPEAYQPADDGQNDKKEREELTSGEMPAEVEGEVLAKTETVVESSFVVKQSSTDQEIPAIDSTDSLTPAVELSHGEDKETATKVNACVVESATETASCAPENESGLDVEQTTGLTMDEPVMEADSSTSRVETEQHAPANLSESIKDEPLAVETESCGTDLAPLEVTVTPNNSVQEPVQPPQKLPPKRDSSVSLSSEPFSPSKTKWYFVLDEKEGWSVPNEAENDRHPLPSTSSDSTTDVDSVKSLPRQSAPEDDDELLAMCRNIREARLSVVGLPLWEGADRVRALSSISDKGGQIVRLKTLERTLKDKERALSRLEELLADAHDPEVNKQSLREWTVRHSELLDEMVSHEGMEVETEKEKPKQGEDEEKKEYENVIENNQTIDIRSAEEETITEEMTEKRGYEQVSSGDQVKKEEEEERENQFSQTVVDGNKEGGQTMPVGKEEGKNDKQPAHQEGEGESKEQVQEKERNQEQQNKASKDSEDGEGTQSPGESSAEITLITEAVVTVQEIEAEKERIGDRSALEEHGQGDKESFHTGSGEAVLSEDNHAMEGEENGQAVEDTRL